jgi:hypothetical protein
MHNIYAILLQLHSLDELAILRDVFTEDISKAKFKKGH